MEQRERYAQVHPNDTGYRYAGFFPRLLGYIIDTIFISLMALIVAFSISILGDLSTEMTLEAAYLASGLISIPYVIGFWAMAGGTPGKIILGMRIVGPDGSTDGIGWGRATLRFLGSILSVMPCYLGYIWIVIDRNKQGWHDKIAGTRVVNV